MKALIVLGILALSSGAVADDEARSYDVRATRYWGTYNVSCGAKARMLKDRHRIVLGEGVTINRLPWDLIRLRYESGGPQDMRFSFHERKGQKTFLRFDVYVNDRSMFGHYSLLGVTPKGELCSDIVEIRGSRR